MVDDWIKQMREYQIRLKTFPISKELELQKNEFGNLTVEGVRDVLNELIKKGYKDYTLGVRYDGGLATAFCTDDIDIDEKEKEVIINE